MPDSTLPKTVRWFGRELPEYTPKVMAAQPIGLYHVTAGVVLVIQEIPGVAFPWEASLISDGAPTIRTIGNATMEEAIRDLEQEAARMKELWGRICG